MINYTWEISWMERFEDVIDGGFSVIGKWAQRAEIYSAAAGIDDAGEAISLAISQWMVKNPKSETQRRQIVSITLKEVGDVSCVLKNKNGDMLLVGKFPNGAPTLNTEADLKKAAKFKFK